MSTAPATRASTSLPRPLLWGLFGALMLAVPIAARLATLPRPGAVGLPRYGRLPAFSLVDQSGHPFSASDLSGHVAVIDFVFTSCSQVCPRLTSEMAHLSTYLTNRALDVHLVSFTVDPARDTVERLSGFAAGFHADPARWHFVTGPTEKVQDAVIHGFKISIEKGEDGQEFNIIHGTHFILVDAGGQIRGYYDANETLAMSRLRDDVDALARAGGK